MTAVSEFEIKYRDMASEDQSFVFSAWLRSVRNESPAYSMVTDRLFFKEHHDVVERLFSASPVVVACLADDPSVLIGFACGDHTKHVVHYFYVKSDFRRMGIATAMLKVLRVDIKNPEAQTTHWTRFCSKARHKILGLAYNPYLLR